MNGMSFLKADIFLLNKAVESCIFETRKIKVGKRIVETKQGMCVSQIGFINIQASKASRKNIKEPALVDQFIHCACRVQKK